MKFFSLVVPVYNVQNYLDECLESILSQTFDNYEVILINDGSTDDSLKIAKSYAQKSDKIILIDQENKGLSVARNVGIKHAKGKYVCFIDSDDRVSRDYLAKAHEILKVNTIDLPDDEKKFFASKQEDGKIDVLKIQRIDSQYEGRGHLYDGYEFLKGHSAVLSWGCAWLYVCRREFLREMQIDFCPNILYEDMIFISKIILRSQRFYVSGIKAYDYRMTDNSIMRGTMDEAKSTKSLKSYFAIMNYFINEAKLIKKGGKNITRNSLPFSQAMVDTMHLCIPPYITHMASVRVRSTPKMQKIVSKLILSHYRKYIGRRNVIIHFIRRSKRLERRLENSRVLMFLYRKILK